MAIALAARATAGTVDADEYDAFWLWGGVTPQPALHRARSVYVLQGQVGPDAKGTVGMDAQGIAVTALGERDVWLVYRAHTLRWPADVYRIVLAQRDRWRRAGNRVAGVQIDFDARTSHLDEYAAFLRDLRTRLPAECRLSITGLLDWSTNADPAMLAGLAGVVDEVIVQTYQGRHTIADYRRYVPRLERMRLPFKVGLVQDGEWEAPPGLVASPWFRGYVVFLRNRSGARAHESRPSG